MTSNQETGGAVIDSYHVELYDGSTWITVSGGGGTDPGTYSTSTVVVADGLTGGQTYRIRARAHNIHGWGQPSLDLVSMTTGKPNKPSPTVV